MRRLFYIVPLLLLVMASFGQQTPETLTNSDQINKEVLNNDTTVYTDVDTAASFPGGQHAWIKHIERYLNPAVGVENSARKGTYKVIIKFIVTKDGTLNRFIPVTKHKHGFEEEVIRVLKLSPRWIPAKKNGKPVNSWAEQTQVFTITVG